MLIFDIPLIVIGAVLAFYGFFIFFMKRHDLIQDFAKIYEKYTEHYAARLGLIEFIGGLICIGAGVCGIVVDNFLFSAIVLFACPMLVLAANGLNTLLSLKK